MLKFQKILDKSRIGVYNHIVRSYSRTADNKCVMGAVFRHMPSPLLQRAAVWCKAVKPPRAIRP